MARAGQWHSTKRNDHSHQLVWSKEFEKLLDDAYVGSLSSDNESVDSDVIDSDEKNDDEEIAVEMLLMASEGEFQQEDSEDDMPLSMLRTTQKKQVKEKSKPLCGAN
ncbi:hypothetical protein JTB14_001806 [Gonioctena quinquepunctata]|nr:hypothetical protein JTB14_001806 [Gonioctena quinquepunctata]